MGALVQYDLFEKEKSEVDRIKEEMAALKESQDKVRRGLFKRFNEMSKLIIQQHNEIEGLRKIIVKEYK